MFLQLLIGTIAIVITFAIHAVVLDYIIRHIKSYDKLIAKKSGSVWKIFMSLFVVLGIFGAHVLQIWLWAFLYILLGEFPDMESALYFSTSSFTTVGFGDVYLDSQWRLLSTIEAANGFLLFGWSTAFIFEFMSKVYKREMQ